MTDTLTQNILEQILLYARRDKNNINFDLRKAELLRFFGIIILSGYHKLPSEKDSWSNQPDLEYPSFLKHCVLNVFFKSSQCST